ncbi:hypothetical protein ACA910_021572 [Epithemia clementina (nom. ined.)]
MTTATTASVIKRDQTDADRDHQVSCLNELDPITGKIKGRYEEECCLMNDACLQETARQIARVWTKKPWELWCKSTAQNQSSTNDSGGMLWLIKVPKSASSTMAG